MVDQLGQKPGDICKLSKEDCKAIGQISKEIQDKPQTLKELLERLEQYVNVHLGEIPGKLSADILSHYTTGNFIALEAIGGESFVISYLDDLHGKLILKIARPKKMGYEKPRGSMWVKKLFDPGTEEKKISISRERFREGCMIQSALNKEATRTGKQNFVIPFVLSYSETPSLHLVMEYIEGINIVRWLKDKKDVLIALRLFLKLLECVDFAHSLGIVHRDIKSENIIYTSNDRVAVVDWTLARKLDRELTLVGTPLGTVKYSAPEQMEDGSSVTELSDIFALGMVFWEFIQAKQLFEPMNLDLKKEDDKRQFLAYLEGLLPNTFREIFRNSANIETEARYENCKVFHDVVSRKIEEIERERNLGMVTKELTEIQRLEKRIEALEKHYAFCNWHVFLKGWKNE